MKQCSYCGAQYPDDATECAIDKTPFENAEPESGGIKLPTFAIFSEHRIPVSLVIVSYLYFLPAAICFAYFVFMGGLLICSGGFAGSGLAILSCAVAGVFGIFFVSLSRGLRRCSPGWRTCALFFIWWGFIAVAYAVGQYFFTHKTPEHESVTEFFGGNALGFAVGLWQYRVLTRSDVRELFGI